jgi:hypothetical protein
MRAPPHKYWFNELISATCSDLSARTKKNVEIALEFGDIKSNGNETHLPAIFSG